MLDSTHDPINVMINGMIADIMEYTSDKHLDHFKENSESLNDISTCPQFEKRAEDIGYKSGQPRNKKTGRWQNIRFNYSQRWTKISNLGIGSMSIIQWSLFLKRLKLINMLLSFKHRKIINESAG